MTDKTIRLGSSQLIHTPGIARWLHNAAETGDLLYALNVAVAGWPDIPAWALRALLLGDFDIDNDVVILTQADPKELS